MPDPPPDQRRHLPVTRRAFLACCASLAAAGGCGSLGDRMRSAYVFAHDPAPDAYRPVFRGLIRTFLPFEHPDFPLTPDTVEYRLLDLFHFEDDQRYLQLQQTLLFFDDLDLFGFPLVLTESERVARDITARGLDDDQVLAGARQVDAALARSLAAEAPPARRFVDLPLDGQRAYVALWARSGFLVKRRFHAAARALIMISAYSLDAMWPAIGYEGPRINRPST
jgi:hypothetical protein